MRLTFLAALTLVLFAARVSADTPGPKQPKPVTVPFELLRSGHIVVMVKANGKGPFLLIFDTGAPMSLVNNKLAKEAGLLKGVKKPPFTMFGSMGEVKIKTLQVGDATAEDVSAIRRVRPPDGRARSPRSWTSRSAASSASRSSRGSR